MAWGKKSSNGPVTVAYLLERHVNVSWQDAVAIVLEIAEVFERSGKRSLPRHDNLALTPSGTIDFRRGRTQSGHAVSALASTLNVLTPRDRPTQLRLLVSTAGPDSASSKSVKEFIEALQYFERPGRRSTISEVYQRALETPLPTASTPDEEMPKFTRTPRKPKKRSRRWVLVPAAVALLLAVVAGGATLIERSDPGVIRGRTAPFEGMATDAWGTALEATATFRESAARDLSMVLERMRAATEDALNEETEPADDADTANELTPVSTGSQQRAPAPPAPAAENTTGEGGLRVTSSAGEGSSEDLAALARAPVDEADLLATATLFDSSDVNVTPPVTVRLQLPSMAEEQPWTEEVGVVEAIVAANGQVERVKLISPPESIHQAMILSAIKTWRFRPARKDGQPVRYRQLIPVAVPR